MHQEAIDKEVERIIKSLEKVDPTTEAYSTGVKNAHEWMKCIHEELEAEDSRLNNLSKRELDEERMALNQTEEKNRTLIAKLETIFSALKVPAATAGAIIGIIVTAYFERESILSQKCFSILRGLFPAIR